MSVLNQMIQVDELPEQEVVNFLRRHPDFFNRHEELLPLLDIPHSRGRAVSLVEKQMAVLRDENQQLQRKLENWVANAKHNDQINKRIQRLLVSLVGASCAEEFLDILYVALREEFNTDGVALRLFELPPLALAGRTEFVEFDAEFFTLFENALSVGKPICGRLSSEQVAYLFPSLAIASGVLIPLDVPKPMGILALGSVDLTRFHAGMATDLLKYMGELISQLLVSWLRR